MHAAVLAWGALPLQSSAVPQVGINARALEVRKHTRLANDNLKSRNSRRCNAATAQACAEMATKFAFQLQRDKGLPEQLIPFLRVCYCKDGAELKQVDLHNTGEITETDAPILQHLVLFLQQRLARCAPHLSSGPLVMRTIAGGSLLSCTWNCPSPGHAHQLRT
jgi:hypothetical protein